MNPTDMAQLRVQVKSLISEPDDREFLKWLSTLAARGQALLNPPNAPAISDRDIIKSFKRFKSDQRVVDWCHAHGIVLAHDEFWWAINSDEKMAHINGLGQEDGASFVGVPRITNGIDVWIERIDGKCLKGHREFLIYHRKPREAKESTKPTPKKCKASAEHQTLAAKLVAEHTVDNFAGRYRLIMEKDLAFGSVEDLAERISEYMDRFLAQAI